LTKLLTLSKANTTLFLRRNLNISIDYKQDRNTERTLKTRKWNLKEQNEPQGHTRTKIPENPYQKLPNGTTMLRNTVAGKAATGPVNTSNSETVAILTP